MSDISIDPWVGQTLKKYRKQKGMTQEALGHAISKKAADLFGRKEKGISKSTISRIEKGIFIPPQNKLEIILNLLDIQSPQERYRLFEYCGYAAPTLQLTQEERFQTLNRLIEDEPEQPLAWIRLISFSNQEKKYHQTLNIIEKASMAFQELSATFKYLLEAKKQFTYVLLGENIAKRMRLTEEALDLAETSFPDLNTSIDTSHKLLCSLFKTRISLLFKRFYHKLTQVNVRAHIDEIKQLYSFISIQIQRFEDSFVLIQENEDETQQSLYIEREKASLDFKWLELKELLSIIEQLEYTWPELNGCQVDFTQIPVYIYGHLKSNSRFQQMKAVRFLNKMYSHGYPVLTPFHASPLLSNAWDEYALGVTIFLENHQPLIQYQLLPEDLPRVPIFQTSLLYVLALARLGKIDNNTGGLFLNTLYFLSDNQSLTVWYYVSSCFYAYKFLKTQTQSDLEKVIAHWMGWVQSHVDNPDFYNEKKFASFLHEPCLWHLFLSAWHQKLHSNSPYCKWLYPKIDKLFTQELAKIKKERELFFHV